MNYENVKQLLEAGFTSDEIRSMLNENNNPQNPQENSQDEKSEHSSAQQPTEDNKKPNDIKPDEKESSVKEPSELEKTVSNLTGIVENLVKTIQASNLKNSSFSKPTDTDIGKQTDNIMASIIRPNREGGN